MNKRNIIIGCVLVFVAIYIGGALLFTQKLLPNTTLSGHDIEMISKSSLEKTVKESFSDQTIAIKDDVITDYTPKLVDLGASIDSEQLTAAIEENQSPLKWPIQIFSDQNYDLTKYIKVDEGKLNGQLVTDKLLTDEGRTKSKDAKAKYSDESKTYEIQKEVNGNILNDDFNSALIEAIKNGDSEFDATAYYVKPKVVTEDLQGDVDKLNARLTRDVSVTFGDKKVTIPKKDVASFIFLDDEGNVDVDNTVLYNYLFELSSEYDSASNSGGGRTVTSYNVDPAYYSIESGLLDDGDSAIVGNTEVQTFKQDAGQTSIPSSSTYIEVSISQQYMWLYNDGELVIKTPVVTGNVSEGWDTPTGTFSVWNKETDKVLNGASVGYDYEVPVDYWMAIDYTGVGIHDIDWLNSGNAEASRDVYKTDGSHGCVNTPDDVMKTVYDNTPLGTPVYVMP